MSLNQSKLTPLLAIMNRNIHTSASAACICEQWGWKKKPTTQKHLYKIIPALRQTPWQQSNLSQVYACKCKQYNSYIRTNTQTKNIVKHFYEYVASAYKSVKSLASKAKPAVNKTTAVELSTVKESDIWKITYLKNWAKAHKCCKTYMQQS